MKYLKWMYLGGTVVSLLVMALRAGLIPQSIAVGADQLKERAKDIPHSMNDLKEAIGDNIPDEVWIDGKKYQANAKHVYDVDGVRSLVKKTGSPEDRESPPQGDSKRIPSATLGDKVLKNPMHAYTPEAMAELKRTLEEAQRQSKERDATLKDLMKE